MSKYFLFFVIIFLIFISSLAKPHNPPPPINEAFKERILNILDSKGEMNDDEKAKMFENLKVAGGSRINPNDNIPKNDEDIGIETEAIREEL